MRCRRHVPAARSDHAERFRGEHLRGRAFHGRRHHDFGAGMEPGRLLPLHARHGRLREQLPEQPGREPGHPAVHHLPGGRLHRLRHGHELGYHRADPAHRGRRV